jgi:arylformamidase
MLKIVGKLIDLTHCIDPNMPVYPGHSKPQLKDAKTFERNRVNLTTIVMGAHVGTHVDAPRHFIKDGATLDEVSLDKFIGEAAVLNLSNVKLGSGITEKDLEPYSSQVKPGDIVVLYTGSSDHWGEPWIDENYTYLDESGAKWLLLKGVKTVAIDCLGVDKSGATEPVAHRILLGSGIPVIETLNKQLRKIAGKRIFLICLPLKLKGREAAPARVIAYPLD